MSENPELISQFTAITGADDDRAKFYLESAAWKLDVAMSRYYENETADTVHASSSESALQHEQLGNMNEEDGEEEEGGLDVEEAFRQLRNSSKKAANNKKRTPARTSNVATLNTLQESSDEDDDDEEEGQAFYAGGSEHSGQQVLGPSKKKRDFIAGMFQSVRKHGVEVNDAGSSSGSKPKSFSGSGYKLGQTADDSVKVGGSASSSSSSTSSSRRPPEVVLKLWRDGFNINDGELRSYTDPANATFLQSVQRGEIPQELRQDSSEVYLAMEDHRTESYKQLKKSSQVKAFSGQGYTLGSPAPAVVGATGEADKTPTNSSADGNATNEARANENLKINESEPTTNLQIRLADGTRLVAQFNSQTHTVRHIREYIGTARPQYANVEFNLISGYPPKVLNDSETLIEANLLNAAVMQKLI